MTWPYSYDTTLTYDVNRLTTTIKLANFLVFRKEAFADNYTGMGTIIVAALVHPAVRSPRRVTWATAGST